jgi:PKD repeat protein
MKNATLLKLASLLIFLLSAQFSFGQTIYCGDYPDWVSGINEYSIGDRVHYQGSIWQSRYGNNSTAPSGTTNNSCDQQGSQWCFVSSCTAGNNPCETTTQITFDDFESGFGNWNAGGNDCFRTSFDYGCPDNSISVVLRDDSGTASSLISDTYNLSSYDKITIEFEYGLYSFETNEDWFLEFSANNGSSWTQIKQYVLDWNVITNNVCYNESVTFLATDQTFNSQNKLRFRADANSDYDYLFINDIKVSGTGAITPTTYTVTGDNLSLCPDDSTTVTQIGLSDSEDTFTYQLLKNGTNEGSAITGTGSAISFGNFNATGTYTIQATGCSSSGVAMSGNVVITNATTPTASFTASATNIDIGDTVSFSDTSTGNPTSWSWDFDGDGIEDDINQNPTHPYTAAGTYTVTLTATNSCGSDTATTSITVYTSGTCSASGTILMERYDGIPGTAISDLTGSANYPENPSSDAQLTSFEIPTDVAENYGAKVSGYICAPQTGYYTFWIASDDNGQLNLSTDDDPANKTTIAWVDSWTSSREWDKFTTQKSDPILLIMGESYYVEALMKENGGGDNLAVGWAKPGESTNAPSQVIPGSVLSPAVSNYFGTDILFSEDQADASQSDSTISGTGTSVTNASGIAWTMNRPNSKVKTHIDSNPHIHCEKLNGDTVTWVTEDIIISGYTNLNFTVFARKIQNYGSNDYIKLQYSIDGGTTRINIATYNTNLTNTSIGGDINTITSTTVVGDTLKIYIEVYNDGNNEKFEWEDITLTGIPFYNVWQGTNIDLVTDTAKWSKGSQPTEASNVWIPNTKHLKLTDDQAYNTVNARATSQLTIEKTGSLTTVGDFTKIAGTGTVTLNSDATEFASIVVGGTAAGDITYNKYVNYQAYEEWDLVGPPVLNQNMKTFAQTNTNNNSTSGAMSMGGDYYALGQYYTGWGSWVNYTTSTIPDANFPVAKGYQMATNAVENNSSLEGQSLTFTGEIATTTQTINIQNQNGANGGYGRRWNLVANPFPSYLNGNTNAGAQNFIDTNEGVIDSSYLAIYAWKADGTGWHTFNQLDTNNDDGTLFIAPGQAFFVAAASTDVAQIQFTPSMRTITGGDDFISGATPMLLNYKLDLKLYNGSAERAKTKLHFQQGLILGLDPGYDAGAYDQATALSSRLPEDDQGVNFQLNAMNLEAAYNQTIPLVVNQQEGQSFRISISNNTLPEDINVYLEDVFNGTLTSLKDQDFELSAESDLSDAGRFYIRFTTQNLAINDVLSPSSLTIFKLNTDAFVTIQGLSPEMGKTTATLYNMLGMKVRSKTLNNTAATQQISTQGLASGVYIIKLKAGEQAVSKKVIIQ